MANRGNIAIADESALYALMHGEWAEAISSAPALTNPLRESASTLGDLSAFNTDHPLYGPPPIVLLVGCKSARRFSDDIACRYMSADLPSRSFFKLRDDLYMAAPELVFLRMARSLGEVRLAEVGMNLCGRYYTDPLTGRFSSRKGFITTPEKLQAYASAASHVLGSKKALAALRWVLPNTGSPYETKMKLLFCHPLGRGGFGLPFTAMNYDVKAGRLQRITAQTGFSIDMVDVRRKFGMEYDGEKSHLDASHDKRRRNELEALGWRMFPIDRQVLGDVEATIRAAEQAARIMGVRMRRGPGWEVKHMRLRADLGLGGG